MTNPPPPSDRSESAAAIEATALNWAAKADRGPLSAQDQAALEAWAEADPRRAGAYARALAANAYFDRAAALGPGFRPERRVEARPMDRRRLLALGGGVLAMSVAAAIGAPIFMRRDRIVTPKGDVRRISLAEGSAITLNTDTALQPSLGPEMRRVDLVRGEALFDVARDPARPFMVFAGDVRIQAVGTSFTVRMHDDRRVEVAVREGVVEVRRSTQTEPVRLGVQDVAVVPVAGGIAKAAAPAGTLERAMAWREGRLDLAGMTLAEAAAEFSRYSDRLILIDDPSVAAMRVAGVYSISDPEGFARAAALSLDLEAEAVRNGVKLRRPEMS